MALACVGLGVEIVGERHDVARKQNMFSPLLPAVDLELLGALGNKPTGNDGLVPTTDNPTHPFPQPDKRSLTKSEMRHESFGFMRVYKLNIVTRQAHFC